MVFGTEGEGCTADGGCCCARATAGMRQTRTVEGFMVCSAGLVTGRIGWRMRSRLRKREGVRSVMMRKLDSGTAFPWCFRG